MLEAKKILKHCLMILYAIAVFIVYTIINVISGIYKAYKTSIKSYKTDKILERL